jgi:hypothetical protein
VVDLFDSWAQDPAALFVDAPRPLVGGDDPQPCGAVSGLGQHGQRGVEQRAASINRVIRNCVGVLMRKVSSELGRWEWLMLPPSHWRGHLARCDCYMIWQRCTGCLMTRISGSRAGLVPVMPWRSAVGWRSWLAGMCRKSMPQGDGESWSLWDLVRIRRSHRLQHQAVPRRSFRPSVRLRILHTVKVMLPIFLYLPAPRYSQAMAL